MIYLGNFCHELADKAKAINKDRITVEYRYKDFKADGTPDQTSQIQRVDIVRHSRWKFWQEDPERVAIRHKRLVRANHDYSREVHIGRAYAMRDTFEGRVEKYKKTSDRWESHRELSKERQEVSSLLSEMEFIYHRAKKALEADENAVWDSYANTIAGRAKELAGVERKPLKEVKFSGEDEEWRLRIVKDQDMLNDLEIDIQKLKNRSELLRGIIEASDYSRPRIRTVFGVFKVGGKSPIKPTIEQNKAIIKSSVVLKGSPFELTKTKVDDAVAALQSQANALHNQYAEGWKVREEAIREAEQKFLQEPSKENLVVLKVRYKEAREAFEVYEKEINKLVKDMGDEPNHPLYHVKQSIGRYIQDDGFALRPSEIKVPAAPRSAGTMYMVGQALLELIGKPQTEVMETDWRPGNYSLENLYIRERLNIHDKQWQVSELLRTENLSEERLEKARDLLVEIERLQPIVKEIFNFEKEMDARAVNTFLNGGTLDPLNKAQENLSKAWVEKAKVFYDTGRVAVRDKMENKDWFVVLDEAEQLIRQQPQKEQKELSAASKKGGWFDKLAIATQELLKKKESPQATGVQRLNEAKVKIQNKKPGSKFVEEWVRLKRIEIRKQGMLEGKSVSLSNEEIENAFKADLLKLGLLGDDYSLSFAAALEKEPDNRDVLRANMSLLDAIFLREALEIKDLQEAKKLLIEANNVMGMASSKVDSNDIKRLEDLKQKYEQMVDERARRIPDDYSIPSQFFAEGGIEARAQETAKRLAEKTAESFKSGARAAIDEDIKILQAEAREESERVAREKQMMETFFNEYPEKWLKNKVQRFQLQQLGLNVDNEERLDLEAFKNEFVQNIQSKIPANFKGRDELIQKLEKGFDMAIRKESRALLKAAYQ